MRQMHPAASASLLDQLILSLETLDPGVRDTVIADFLDRLTQATSTEFTASPVIRRSSVPVTLCDWATDCGAEGSTHRLSIDVQPGPDRLAKTESATGRALLSNGYMGADIIHVAAGTGFDPHTHPGDHLLFAIAGYGTITADGVISRTVPGTVYMIEGAVPHAVGAITDHMLLSVGSRHRPLTSADRQELVPFSALLSAQESITCSICSVTANSRSGLVEQGCTHAPNSMVNHSH
jgi:quercetin dioxygenase-like cupin family protein